MPETEADKKHRRITEKQLSPEGKKYFKLIEFDVGEDLVTEVRKHPIGLLFVLLSGGFVILALLITILLVSLTDFDVILGIGEVNSLRPFFALIVFLVIIATATMTLAAAFLYQSSVIFVTTEKIAQVLYVSLFHRTISQLSIGDVQDVTITQKGILAHFFDYGTLVIETAGEQENYKFSYVPNPHKVSKQIVSAHELNLREYGN